MSSSPHPNQFALLRQRRFAPFFWTQFLGAGNDNLFKFSLTVLVTYQLQVAWLPASLAGLVIGALFILPFLLFSATSGQLADKLEKTRIVRFVKNLEIAIMVVAALGFLTQNVGVLLGCVFLMGLHSTLFGPVKYAYLPQHLDEHELTGGNGMIEMGTFVAILLGNLLGGLLMSMGSHGAQWAATLCVVLALWGRWTAQAVPDSPPTDPHLRINWNPFTETWRNLALAAQDKQVLGVLLGISWMWFYGAVFLSLFPVFAKDTLHGSEGVASLLLVLFSVGIGLGSLLCEVFSRGKQVELALVPIGALGMTVFALDVWWVTDQWPDAAHTSALAFLLNPAHWRLMWDLFMLSLSAGLFSVPLYAFVQLKTPATHRARIIAANNIWNALFMIASALKVGALIQAGMTVPAVFGLVGAVNAVVGLALCLGLPAFRSRVFALTRRSA